MAEHWRDCDGSGREPCPYCDDGLLCGCFEECGDTVLCFHPRKCEECGGRGFFLCPGCAEQYEEMGHDR